RAIAPVIDRLSRDAQLGRDGGDRAILIQLQESQGSAEDVRTMGRVARSSQPEALLGCQVEVHGPAPGDGSELEWRRPFHRNPLICSRGGQKVPENKGLFLWIIGPRWPWHQDRARLAYRKSIEVKRLRLDASRSGVVKISLPGCLGAPTSAQ